MHTCPCSIRSLEDAGQSQEVTENVSAYQPTDVIRLCRHQCNHKHKFKHKHKPSTSTKFQLYIHVRVCGRACACVRVCVRASERIRDLQSRRKLVDLGFDSV